MLDPPGKDPQRETAGPLVIPLIFSLSTARLLFRMTATVLFPAFWLTLGITQLSNFYKSNKSEVALPFAFFLVISKVEP